MRFYLNSIFIVLVVLVSACFDAHLQLATAPAEIRGVIAVPASSAQSDTVYFNCYSSASRALADNRIGQSDIKKYEMSNWTLNLSSPTDTTLKVLSSVYFYIEGVETPIAYSDSLLEAASAELVTDQSQAISMCGSDSIPIHAIFNHLGALDTIFDFTASGSLFLSGEKKP